ncbi:MAG: CoA transferase [Nannocystis sp.]|uniref:CaiB/BaiF CoA transferase family protein n=1 Tax=Nannocystis sp. TaxID=1962667 RepID=UPI002424BAAB|nr:CaiB/BaiF CoA-transferase family protein [Nannocystis sp.]MBK9755015.1 CoA transferase [Nannocystis sp.]
MTSPAPALPLAGVTVLDVSRMLPGAVLARSLVDLGARVIKIEDPRSGDLMRLAPPLVGGIGVGFCVYYRGTESVGLDLRDPDGAAALRLLAGRADVLIESFRPGTMERYGLATAALRADNPRLVVCSLPGFLGNAEVGHDLNFTGLTGFLREVTPQGIPALQIADVTSGLLASTAILAALLQRHRSGEGCELRQPLLAGPLPFVTWAASEVAAGGGGMASTMLGGAIAAYRCYRCGDGLELAVGCLEPKFWIAFATLVGRPELAGSGLDPSPDGAATVAAMQAWLASEPRAHWLAKVAGHALPVWPVHTLAEAANEPTLAPLREATPMPDGSTLAAAGPSLPGLGRTPMTPAPALGAHTAAVLAEFGAPAELIARLIET